MLERIHQIIGVGLFKDTRPAGMTFKKMTLIYADNGRGKSTLASIMRSYTENQPEIVLNRKTIGENLSPHVSMQFSNGNRADFSNGQWNSKFSDTHVFDLDFVDRNVYSGGEISPGHRKRLLSFALGREAVSARAAFNAASSEAEEAKRATRTASDKLTGFRGNIPLARYIKILPQDAIETKITAIKAELDLCARMDSIRNRGGYQTLSIYAPDFEKIFTTLRTTYDNLSKEAEESVNSHISHIDAKGFDRWVSSGLDYIKDDECPFCTQNLSGIELIKHYRERFNQKYRSLIGLVTELDGDLSTAMRTFNFALLESKLQQADGVTENWKDCLSLAIVKPDLIKIQGLTARMHAALTDVIETKKFSPLVSPDSGYENEVTETLAAINDALISFNKSVVAANQNIQVYKDNLVSKNEAALQEKLAQLEVNRSRHSQEVITLVSEYLAAKALETSTVEFKETLRGELNAIMDATLGRYEASINELLMKFGASFRISEINYNYAGGGEPKSEYAIELRGEKIALTGEGTSFRGSLSEGDKRTLAFAFFISVIFHDADLANKIIIIDDPMCSLDSHRKNHTINIIKQAFIRSQQVIILAHDLYFIRAMRNEFLKMSVAKIQDLSELRIVHSAGDYSDISRLDIDLECESPYYKNHRLVSEFTDGVHQNLHDTAVALRPLLEGYLHRRFPGKIPSGKLFGEVVSQIAQARQGEPLFHAHSLVAELNELNNYAGRYHHDINPEASSEPINPGELKAYTQRALNVIYRGNM
jgi:wobble nucleotide-excising tRNase